MQNTSFVSERISRSAQINLNTPVADAFLLFGPVKEMEWTAGWEPEIIYGHPSVIEEHMIFQTHGNEEEGKYTWAISQFDPENYLIEYTVSTPNRIWFICVLCVPHGDKTQSTISYTFTGLTPRGNELNRNALEKMYVDDLMDWEEDINFYLSTGKRNESV